MVNIVGESYDNPREIRHHHYPDPLYQDGTVTEYRDRVVTLRAIPWWWIALLVCVGLGLGFWLGPPS